MAAAPKVTQWLLRVGPGGKKRVNEADTRRVMGAVGEINPSLRGAETPEDVQKLVWREATKDTSGPGLPRMNAEKERVAGVVENRLPGNLPGTEASPGAGFNPPYDVKLGAGQIAIPSLGENGKPAVMTVKEANAVLSDIGDAMRGKKVLDPRYGNQDPARLYAKVRREISEGIEAAETGVDVAARNAMARPRWEPKHGADNLARELWEAGQTDYRKGRVLYDFLRDSKVLDQDGMLNMRKLQLMISTDPERAAKLQRALGEKDFEKFQQALFRGEKPMGADKPATGGGELLDPLRQTVAGTNTGSGNLKRSVLSAIGLPNLGTKYVGKLEPLTAPAWVEPTANVITKVPKGLGYLGEHVLRSGAAAQQRARDEKAKKKK
jgi:hypothetical protein